MTFDLITIALFCAFALLYSAFVPKLWRSWVLFIGSVLAVYWLQPRLNIRFLDFVLPTATIAVTVMVWWFTRKPDEEQTKSSRADWLTIGIITALIVFLSLMRFIQPEYRLTASRPPNPLYVGIALLGFSAVVFGVWRLTRPLEQRRVLTGVILCIVGLFVALKAEPIATEISRVLRSGSGQDTTLAGAVDLGWLGFSYVAFRLIHTLRDRQTGKLPALSLQEYVTYVVFFPSFIAGPIDRAERFVKDYRALPEITGLAAPRFIEGSTRISVGIFKKFVIADSLALGVSLNATNALQTESAIGMWILLYGYALRLFFDFSGYSDIAIGIGILFGIKLPENFNRPYLKTDIASFWQSWHITLSNWARFYIFTPFSRALLTREQKPPTIVIVLSSQLATMIVIGLWHGITLNFLIWGIWHGVGLFIHKQWSDRTRKWYRSLNEKPIQRRAWMVTSWFITFHFVVLGWVWFALPEFSLSLQVFGQLFGL